MAKKQMVISTCDRCSKEVMFPLGRGDVDKITLPSNWLHVEGITNKKVIFELDLCEDCKVDVLNAAGEGK